MTPHIEHHAGRDGDGKSAGQIAYERDVAKEPFLIWDHTQRQSWESLSHAARATWEEIATRRTQEQTS